MANSPINNREIGSKDLRTIIIVLGTH